MSKSTDLWPFPASGSASGSASHGGSANLNKNRDMLCANWMHLIESARGIVSMQSEYLSNNYRRYFKMKNYKLWMFCSIFQIQLEVAAVTSESLWHIRRHVNWQKIDNFFFKLLRNNYDHRMFNCSIITFSNFVQSAFN